MERQQLELAAEKAIQGRKDLREEDEILTCQVVSEVAEKVATVYV